MLFSVVSKVFTAVTIGAAMALIAFQITVNQYSSWHHNQKIVFPTQFSQQSSSRTPHAGDGKGPQVGGGNDGSGVGVGVGVGVTLDVPTLTQTESNSKTPLS